MGNRSNINLVGNTTQGQNVGTGDGVYIGKSAGNILQYKSLQVTGTTMVITTDDNNIYFSAATGGGGGLTATNNGLCDNGTTVGLGGTLANDTVIDGDGCGLSFKNLGAFNVTGTTSFLCMGSSLSIRSGGLSIFNGIYQAVSITSTCRKLQDNQNSEGFIYGADYSVKGGVNPRWIPDAAWVTGQTGGGLWTQGTGVITPTTITNDVVVANNECFGWDSGAFMKSYTGTTNNAWCIDSGTGECIALSLAGSMIASVLSLTITDAGFENYITIGNSGSIAGHKDVNISGANSGDATAACDVCVHGGVNTSSGLGGSVYICGSNSSTGTGGSVQILAGIGNSGVTNGRIKLTNLPACTTEICTVFIDTSGNLSTGVGGGASAISGWTCAGTSKGVSIGNYTYPYAAGSFRNNDDNVAIGTWILCSNTTGAANTALGTYNLCSNTTGNLNTVIGHYNGVANTSGFENVYVGSYIAEYATTGSTNVGIGTSALSNLTTGDNNIGIGASAVANITCGCNNVGIGECALCDTFCSCHNVGIGAFAGARIFCGCDNIAIGECALIGPHDGHRSIAIGMCAGVSQEDADENIYIGMCAGFSNAVGNRNVFIGRYSGSGSTGSDVLRVGNKKAGDLIYGCFSNDSICNAADSPSWNTVSDSRIKECVCTIPNALCTINELNPVVFSYIEDHATACGWDEEKRNCNYSFIAQEFETVFPKYVTTSCGKIGNEDVDDFKSINIGHLVPILIKAIQELEARIAILEG